MYPTPFFFEGREVGVTATFDEDRVLIAATVVERVVLAYDAQEGEEKERMSSLRERGTRRTLRLEVGTRTIRLVVWARADDLGDAVACAETALRWRTTSFSSLAASASQRCSRWLKTARLCLASFELPYDLARSTRRAALAASFSADRSWRSRVERLADALAPIESVQARAVLARSAGDRSVLRCMLVVRTWCLSVSERGERWNECVHAEAKGRRPATAREGETGQHDRRMDKREGDKRES